MKSCLVRTANEVDGDASTQKNWEDRRLPSRIWKDVVWNRASACPVCLQKTEASRRNTQTAAQYKNLPTVKTSLKTGQAVSTAVVVVGDNSVPWLGVTLNTLKFREQTSTAKNLIHQDITSPMAWRTLFQGSAVPVIGGFPLETRQHDTIQWLSRMTTAQLKLIGFR